MFCQNDDPEAAPRAILAMLREVPHFLLGRAEGAHDITVHVSSDQQTLLVNVAGPPEDVRKVDSYNEYVEVVDDRGR